MTDPAPTGSGTTDPATIDPAPTGSGTTDPAPTGSGTTDPATTDAAAAFDLHAYLAAIGASVQPPSEAALTTLLQAHARTFPFENVDVLLAQHPGVDLASVQAKLVGRRRGGYCFEHATLMHAALVALGYDATRHLARVGDPLRAPRTHLAIAVALDGRRLLVDPGIGVPPLEPIELADGARTSGGLWPHEIRRSSLEGAAGPSWELWRRRAGTWEHMHTTDELLVRDVDVAMGHRWTSTAPTSHFRSSLTINRHGLDGAVATLTTVNHRTVTTSRADAVDVERRDYEPDELRELAPSLGTHLTDAELDRLVQRVHALRAGR